ncbi:MAG: biopolymer transporter ExbB [Lentisphaerae bacterium GWF2_44_16]|nr:MAG: biopolymer transporter ExbB [Lentisphaerae bacterium GWF2_44_16]
MIFYQMMIDGGPVMWVILACSIVAMFVFLEKWFHFHREQVNVGELVTGLINVLKRDGIVEAISLCDNTPGPVARVLMSAILAYEKGDEDIRQAIEDAALTEVPRLERRLNLLATVAYIAPLLGLLGTVLGMMGAFQKIHTKAGIYLSAADLSGDINMALITTAAGLCVAIPCYVAYNYLVSRVQSFALEIEKASSEIIYFFKHRQPERKSENAERQQN